MVETLDFRRARRPEQISARRQAILAAAAALFDEQGPDGAGLNAIAARAGFTKSNVYRYFESREAVLLSLFLLEFGDLTADLSRRLTGLTPGDQPAVARTVAGAFIARPRLCALMGILSGVLERNVSAEAVRALKRDMLADSKRVAAALSQALPEIPAVDCAWGAAVVGTYIAGLWPAAHPAPIVAEVVSSPEFAPLKPQLDRDLERMITTLLKGLTP